MIYAGLQTATAGPASSPTRRALILHDTLAFLVLTAVAVALFGVTLFLFRSFNGHRAELARDSADRGRVELKQGQPGEAVKSLRAALSYAPDDYVSQLLLAQALAESGESDQATNYFLNLWAAKPGDGFINLQLARLARRKDAEKDADRYYRASIFGDWRGDGSIKRRDVRLELVDYLIEQKDNAAARVELLIAAGNAPNNLHLDRMFADRLLATGDTTDALTYYQKAIAENPRNLAALVGEAKIVYDQGDYAKAHSLLLRVLEEEPEGAPHPEEIATMAKNAERLMQLSLSPSLPAHERAQHIVADAKIAQARLASCLASSTEDTDLAGLQVRWTEVGVGAKRSALIENAAGQDTLTQLIFDTERESDKACGAATVDDALLLKLAQQNAGPQ